MSRCARVHLSFPPRHLADANAVRCHPAEDAAWIWHPDRAAGETAFVRFRLRFECAERRSLLLHVSADQRFQLRLDGEELSFGPDRCDLEHWTVHSLRLEAGPGPHTLEALVWFIAPADDVEDPDRVAPPMAQMSWRGGFLLKAEDHGDLRLDTGDAAWMVADLTDRVGLRRPRLVGYHDIGPEFSFACAGWQTAPETYATVVRPAQRDGLHGVRRPGWCLHPASMPEQRREDWRGGRARALRFGAGDQAWSAAETRGPALAEWQALVERGTPLTLPPHTRATLIWDFEDYLCGYPDFRALGPVELAWSWAESLYEAARPGLVDELTGKGQRDDIVGKVFLGIEDRWSLGETDAEHAAPPVLWWRAGRYARLTVTTQGGPATLLRVGVRSTGYPLDKRGAWDCDDESQARLAPIFERGLRRAAHELWTDTPYYEQLGYVGDNVIMARHNYAWFGDAGLSRRAIELFDWSRRESGLVAERYPSGWRQESGTFALLWPGLLRDYAWWRDDARFVRERLPGLRSLMAELEALATPAGLIGRVPGWPFMDWCPEWPQGCAPGASEGASSLVNLHWALALQAAAAVERQVGDAALAGRHERMAREVFRQTRSRFWDEGRACLRDSTGPEASELGQALFLLVGQANEADTRACLAALRRPERLTRATIYGSYWVLEALAAAGDGEELQRRLADWRGLAERGFLCTPEQPEPTRSDAHAWGTHPAWHQLASVAGVRPAAPGFTRARIAPLPGGLRRLECAVAHPKGRIEARLRFEDDAAIGEIVLPEGVTGDFIWKGEAQELRPGSNEVEAGAARIWNNV